MEEERVPLEPTAAPSTRGKAPLLPAMDDIGTSAAPPQNGAKNQHQQRQQQQQQQCDQEFAHLLQCVPRHHPQQPHHQLQQQQPQLPEQPLEPLAPRDHGGNTTENAHSSFPQVLKRKSRADDDSKPRTAVAAAAAAAAKESGIDNCDNFGPEACGIGAGGAEQCKSSSEMLVVHLIVGFRDICVFTLVLPLGTLLVCFVSAYVFQPEEIHETHCRVYNIIPSISAITGVSPQRYLWRVSIALHIGPRFIIAFVYRNWYRAMIASISDPERIRIACRMINVVYWLNLVEISALCGVTYISNKENYPLHEKVFIIFMTTSLSYMLATLKLIKILQPDGPQTPNEESSLRYKQAFFALSVASTIGLILFFLKHRFLCQDLAFSWFALCEYIVASANMGFHCTTMLDFPTEDFLIARNAKHYKKPYSSLGWKLE